jgi:hypothetical protein
MVVIFDCIPMVVIFVVVGLKVISLCVAKQQPAS